MDEAVDHVFTLAFGENWKEELKVQDIKVPEKEEPLQPDWAGPPESV
jgi:hypothetical protein